MKIRDHIKKKLDFRYDYIGEHSVKNISDPVRVYKVLMEPKDAGKRIKEESDYPVKKSRLKKWLRIMASIILILFAILAGVYWKYIYLPTPADIDPNTTMEFNLPKGPSIAVLPFNNMSGDPEQEYFCDGITENIISTLAQTQQLLVIARNSTFAYKDKSIDVRQIGHELGAKYLIEGSIQKSNTRFRIVVQLIDTDSGLHIWSESYDREFKDIFDLQDEIALEILKAVGIKLGGLGGYRSIMEGIGDINSFIKIVKIREYYENPNREEFSSVLKNAEEIIVLNPGYRYRYNMLAVVYLTGAMTGFCESKIICMFKASEAVKKSLSLDENNFFAQMNLGWLFFMRKEPDKAILAYKKAIELNPTFADAYNAMGILLNSADEPSKALKSMKIAIRLNPIPPASYFQTLGWSYLLLMQYEKSIEMYKRCLERQQKNIFTYLMLAIAYGYSGQEKNAKAVIKKILNLVPDYSIAKYKKNIFFIKNHEARLEKAIKTLRKAGLPE